jgi:hypothetical protein
MAVATVAANARRPNSFLSLFIVPFFFSHQNSRKIRPFSNRSGRSTRAWTMKQETRISASLRYRYEITSLGTSLSKV